MSLYRRAHALHLSTLTPCDNSISYNIESHSSAKLDEEEKFSHGQPLSTTLLFKSTFWDCSSFLLTIFSDDQSALPTISSPVSITTSSADYLPAQEWKTRTGTRRLSFPTDARGDLRKLHKTKTKLGNLDPKDFLCPFKEAHMKKLTGKHFQSYYFKKPDRKKNEAIEVEEGSHVPVFGVLFLVSYPITQDSNSKRLTWQICNSSML